jgi:hypothetical protein
MYIIKLYEEIRLWMRIKSIAKEFAPILNESGFRVDWVGRIYTIINLPEEVVNQYNSIEGYILMRFREYDELFLKIGIAGEIYPELIKKTESAYLLILSPERIYVRTLPIIWAFLQLFLLGLFLKIGFTFLQKHTGVFTELMKLISL